MASFNAWTSAAVIGGGGVGAEAAAPLAGVPDAGFSAQALVVSAASARAVRNRVLVDFIELPLLFEFFVEQRIPGNNSGGALVSYESVNKIMSIIMIDIIEINDRLSPDSFFFRRS
jgi:hypothetical protein